MRLQFFGSLLLPKQCSVEELSPLLPCCRPSLPHRVRRAPFSRELANTHGRHRCRADRPPAAQESAAIAFAPASAANTTSRAFA